MKTVAFYSLYTAYFVFGFLFACGYLGGNALSVALENDGNIVTVLLGVACLLLLFFVSLPWLFSKNWTIAKRINYFMYSLLVGVPFIAPVFWYLGGVQGGLIDYMGLCVAIFLMTSPLWGCVILRKKTHLPT